MKRLLRLNRMISTVTRISFPGLGSGSYQVLRSLAVRRPGKAMGNRLGLFQQPPALGGNGLAPLPPLALERDHRPATGDLAVRCPAQLRLWALALTSSSVGAVLVFPEKANSLMISLSTFLHF